MLSRIFRRWIILVALALGALYGFYKVNTIPDTSSYIKSLSWSPFGPKPPKLANENPSKWRELPLQYPIKDFAPLPDTKKSKVPHIQHDFSKYRESPSHTDDRDQRRLAIRSAFEHSWKAYKKHAWLHDELQPLSGQPKDPFGGWGATLIDSLDTLWIMGFQTEFEEAVDALKYIDFTRSNMAVLNVFETIIRYIGGLLGAYDISGAQHELLLTKAIELGEMVYHAFDTPNHMPIPRWNWENSEKGEEQVAPTQILIAELGSLSLEFTRLSQLTGDPKFYDAVLRIAKLLQREQMETRLPGLWPVAVNASGENLHEGVTFTFGGMADSVYEYLPKQYLLLNGHEDMYRDMYLAATDTMKRFLVYEPLIPLQRSKKTLSQGQKAPTNKPSTEASKNEDPDRTLPDEAYDKRDYDSGYEFSPDYSNPLLLGTSTAYNSGDITLDTEGQHLACFAGGMASLAVRAFAPFMNVTHIDEDMDVAERLTAGCVWAYRNTATGISPEIFRTHACRRGRAAVASGERNETEWTGEKPKDCRWRRERWIAAVRDHYISRIDPQVNALAESEDPDRWEHFVEEHHLEEGFIEVMDPRYLLRPEAIESVFVLWRTTGDPKFQDQAWSMWTAINSIAKSKYGYASIKNVMQPPTGPAERRDDGVDVGVHRRAPKNEPYNPEFIDSMESFWTAETLKYFYLIFAEPDVMNLDLFVLNTEAHPLRWRNEVPPPRKPSVYSSYGNNE